eukprot:1880508-Amphidinium_carterae.1
MRSRTDPQAAKQHKFRMQGTDNMFDLQIFTGAGQCSVNTAPEHHAIRTAFFFHLLFQGPSCSSLTCRASNDDGDLDGC